VVVLLGGGSGRRAKVGGAHGRHIRGVEVEGRRLRVLEAPLPPVDECREERDREHDERDAQAEAELGGQGGRCGLGGRGFG
jgi:hypothetical protein